MTLYSLEDIAPTLPENSDFWIAPDAVLIARVILGKAASVWFGATLRGDNEPIVIGPGTNIQEQVVMHTDMGFPLTVGENCTIGHRALLHGCTIGDQTLVGMGAMVMNGAVVGRNCLIGAGALVTEGKEIPDGSLVLGAPGRVIRVLSDKEIEFNRASALSYQKKMRKYRTGLRPVAEAR